MKLYKHMRVEWDVRSDVNEACRKTKGFVVCDRSYNIQKTYNYSLFHEQSLPWWDNVGHMALIYPIWQKGEDKYVMVLLIESVARAVHLLPGIKVGKLFVRNLDKIDPKFAAAARAAIATSRVLNVEIQKRHEKLFHNGDWVNLPPQKSVPIRTF